MTTIKFQDRLRYRFDNTMSKGPIALIGWLFLLSIALISFIALIVEVFKLDPDQRGFSQLAWAELMRTLDSGTMGGDTGSWPFLFAMLATTLGGVFVVSTLIGILTTGLEDKLENLRKGRSFVAEQNHTVILGWSPQIFTLISELVQANANQPRACITILAEKDAVEMQDEVEAKVSNTGRTRIVYRTGAPIDIADLKIVNPDAARSIVILPPEEDNPDAYVIKTMLALTANPERTAKRYHIVTFIRDTKNLDVARMVGREEVELVPASDLIARITAQTCRQSGLSVAYTELLDFGGDEIYIKEEPSLVGKTFGEALFAYEDSAVIGLHGKDDRLQLNPPMQTKLAQGDKLIVISADDDTIRPSGKNALPIETAAICEATVRPPMPERTLILGCNARAASIITELDHYVGPASVMKVVAENLAELNDFLEQNVQGEPYANVQVKGQAGDITDRRTLDALDIPSFQHVIVLSEQTESATEPQQIDARTLITLLHLRDIADKRGNPFSIVSEILDVRNRELAQVTRADDFVVSDKLISLILAQISENKNLARVFQDLFDPDGSEIYFKPACDYVQLGKPVNFYTILEAARRRGEVAIGYRIQAQAYTAEQAYGVKLNPAKTHPITLSKGDRIIVLAES